MPIVSQAPPRSVASRLLRGVSATAVGPLVTAIIQLGPIPLLLHSWGAAKYGDWLLLSAVPSYLTVTNLGFGDASGSDMTLRVAAGDREGALETFQSSWALLTIISVAILIIASIAVWWIPWHEWMNLASLSDHKAAAVILVLAAYIVISQQGGVLESGYRCDGNFALGTLYATVLRLVETLFGLAVGIVTGSLLHAAETYLAVRSVGTLAYALLLRRKSPWIELRFTRASLPRIRALSAPAFGFIALPLGYAISLQGTNLMIGVIKGPIAVAAFSTLRTMTRLNFQLVTVIAWAIWPELSAAFGAGNISLARKLHRHGYQAGLLLSVFTGASLWLLGPFIYHIWIRNAVSFDRACFHVLLIVTFANALWFISSVVSMSSNAHHRLTLIFVVASAGSLVLAAVLTRRFGLAGAAMALLVTDILMIWVVLRASIRQLQDTCSGFLRALLTPVSVSVFARRGEV